jgi:hypothetical protein
MVISRWFSNYRENIDCRALTRYAIELRVSRLRQNRMSHYAFFEYRATITNLTHDESKGESVHCLIKMGNADKDGKRLRNLELEQQAGDDVLFILNPGPHQKVSHSRIWAISEEAFQKAATPLEHHQVGDCEVLLYRE